MVTKLPRRNFLDDFGNRQPARERQSARARSLTRAAGRESSPARYAGRRPAGCADNDRGAENLQSKSRNATNYFAALFGSAHGAQLSPRLGDGAVADGE